MDHAYFPQHANDDLGFSVVAVETTGRGPFGSPLYISSVYLGTNPVWANEADPAAYPDGIDTFAHHTMALFARRLSAVLAKPDPTIDAVLPPEPKPSVAAPSLNISTNTLMNWIGEIDPPGIRESVMLAFYAYKAAVDAALDAAHEAGRRDW